MIGLIPAIHDDDLPVTRLIMHFSFQEKLFFSKLNGEKKHFSPDIAGIGANGECSLVTRHGAGRCCHKYLCFTEYMVKKLSRGRVYK